MKQNRNIQINWITSFDNLYISQLGELQKGCTQLRAMLESKLLPLFCLIKCPHRLSMIIRNKKQKMEEPCFPPLII